MSVRTVAVAGTSFLLREEGTGDGTPVLLLHGVPETSSCWRELAPRLAVGRRVLAPDLPGLGGSSYSGPYDVASLVEQLAALIEAEAGGRPVDVVGHDWGGSLALGLAGARPELVRRLVVANAPYREIPLLRALHIPFFALPVVPEVLFRLAGRRMVRVAFQLAWRAPTPVDPELLAEYEAAYAHRRNVDAMLGYYRAVARPRLAALARREPPAGDPRVRADKMMVLWGALDPVLPVATGEAAVRDLGPDCVMVTVPGAGHFVVEEAPDVVADVLVDFLADAGQEPAVHAAPPVKPARKAPAAQTAKKAPTKKPPVQQAVKKAPTKKAPTATAPAKQAPVRQAPTDNNNNKAPAKKASAKQQVKPPPKQVVKKAPTTRRPRPPAAGSA